jgi:hypothetical protein
MWNGPGHPIRLLRPDRGARWLLRTPAETLHRRRQDELEKAELLDRLESAFSRPTK